MFFSFGRKANGYDSEEEFEYYDDDGFYRDSPYSMLNSTDHKAYRNAKIKSKLKKIKENSRKQQEK